MKYEVVSGWGESCIQAGAMLAENVQSRLVDGWQLHGGVAIAYEVREGRHLHHVAGYGEAMKCTPIQFEVDGQKVNAIVCGSARRPIRCQHQGCGVKGSKLCDWKVGEGKTCDMQLCDAHATQPARGKDLCPAHAAEWEARRK